MELSGKNKTNAFLHIFCTYVTSSSVAACDQTSSINKTKIYINKKSPNTLDSILLPTSVLRNMYKGQNLLMFNRKILLHFWLNPCILFLLIVIHLSQVLKESQKLLEEEILDDEDDYDDQAEYERENDAKRYRNKLLLHNVVLVCG